MSSPKQPLNVYFVMLITSTIMMLLACILMFMEAFRYGRPWESTNVPRVMNSAPAPDQLRL